MADEDLPQHPSEREKTYRRPRGRPKKLVSSDPSSGDYDSPPLSSSSYEDQCFLKESGFISDEYCE